MITLNLKNNIIDHPGSRRRGLNLAYFIIPLSLFLLCGFGNKELKKMCFAKKCLWVETAETEGEHNQGLMLRESMPDSQGMLFLFDRPGQYPIWMKNMLFPIDIIWLDQAKKVVEISSNIQPCQDSCENIIPGSKVMFILETNAGFTEKYGINLGDKARWRF
ncbi:MAG: DUF192 domain-containing protein [Candidatus Omnitrophica bacterium]|nr:DUF192 domain-containing protein [Candidatus Omnitrophota bacterium]